MEDYESNWPAGAVSANGCDRRMDGLLVVWSDAPSPPAGIFIQQEIGDTGQAGEQLIEDFEDRDLDDVQIGITYFHVTGYDGGETQYGSGYGDLYVLAGYYEYELVDRHEAREIAMRCLRREHGRWMSGEAQANDEIWIGPAAAESDTAAADVSLPEISGG